MATIRPWIQPLMIRVVTSTTEATLVVLRSQHVNIWKPWNTNVHSEEHCVVRTGPKSRKGINSFLVCLSCCWIQGWFRIQNQFTSWAHLQSSHSLTQPLVFSPPESFPIRGQPHLLNMYFSRAHGVTDEWWKSWVTLHPQHHCSCLEPTSRCAKTGCDWALIIKGLRMRQCCVQVSGYLQSFIRANFLPHSVVFSRSCCLWWMISDILIAAVGTNYCMQIWARCHFWASFSCCCCQVIVSLLKRHFTVSESACDENPWLALRNCFHGLMCLSKMWVLTWTSRFS